MAGSSPRVRGKHAGIAFFAWVYGLIPACAGKTVLAATADHTQRAHPRVCGENRASVARAVAVAGSSPRVRGKLSLFDPEIPNVGLIPACAGKTGRRRRTSHWC